MTYSYDLPKPKDEYDFEVLCRDVYLTVSKGQHSNMFGRRGQGQNGLDIVIATSSGLLGIQCKNYTAKKFTLAVIEHDLALLDRSDIALERVHFATSARSDAKIVAEVLALSQRRVAAGLCCISVDFWDDIQNHIADHDILRTKYDPFSAGAQYTQLKVAIDTLSAKFEQSSEISLPQRRVDSFNKVVSDQLDESSRVIKELRYKDAQAQLRALLPNFHEFDSHQKARWHLQQGVCQWSLGEHSDAAHSIAEAAMLAPDDDNVAAAQIRGFVFAGALETALEFSKQALQKFPASAQVCFAAAYARISSGLEVFPSEIPYQFRKDVQALRLLAISSQARGDSDAALNYGMQALSHPDATFSIKASALATVVELALRSRAAHPLGKLAVEWNRRLLEAVSKFQPLRANLWRVQAPLMVAACAQDLVLAYELLDNPSIVESVIAEATAHGIESHRLLQSRLESLYNLGRKDEMLALGVARVQQLSPHSIRRIAELAAYAKNPDITGRLLREVSEDDILLKEDIKAFHWLARMGGPESASVHAEIEEHAFSENLLPLIMASRICVDSGNVANALRFCENAYEVFQRQNSGFNAWLMCDALVGIGDYARAALVLSTIQNAGDYLEFPHRYLDCLIKTEQWSLARDFLAQLPTDLTEDIDLFRMACYVAERAGDIEQLVRLSSMLLRAAPKNVESWLLRVSTLESADKPDAIASLIATAPTVLQGSVAQTVLFARYELQIGLLAEGARRMYAMYRKELTSFEKANAYYMTLAPLTFPKEPFVRVGTAVTLADSMGTTFSLVIEPEFFADFPAAADFVQSSDGFAQALLGATCGGLISRTGSFDNNLEYQILSIVTAEEYLITKAFDVLKSPVNAQRGVQLFSLTDATGATNTEVLETHASRNASKIRQVFQEYVRAPHTLTALARYIQKAPIHLLLYWPFLEAPLFVVSASDRSLTDMHSEVLPSIQHVVVDAITLLELTLMRCESALSVFPKVYVTLATKSALQHYLVAIKTDPSVGFYAQQGDRCFVVEADQKAREDEVALLEQALKALADFCTVVPAYGPVSNTTELLQLRDMLDSESMSCLRLCLEKGSALLSLDERFRRIVEEMGVLTCWPQAVTSWARDRQVLSPSQYSLGMFEQMRRGRAHVEITVGDILWFLEKNTWHVQAGLQALTRLLGSSSAEPTSGLAVAREVLTAIAVPGLSLAAFAEVAACFAEGLHRHPRATEALLSEFQNHVDVLMAAHAPKNTDTRKWREYVSEQFRLARERANSSSSGVHVPCLVRPTEGGACQLLYKHQGTQP